MRKRERNIVLLGLALIILILLAGIVAMTMAAKVFENEPDSSTAVRPAIVTTPTAIPTPTAAPEETPTPAPTATPEPTPEPATASIVGTREELNLSGYELVKYTSSEATSTIYQEGYDNNPHCIYDGNLYTSWQEGKEDAGIGESVTFNLEREYKIKYLILNIGNWVNDYSFQANNRPSKMKIDIGQQSFEVNFTDEMKQQCIVLSQDVPASTIRMTIQEVYPGHTYDDTCFSEMEIYGY